MDAAPLPSEVARDSSARDGEDRFVIPLEVWRASRDYKEFDVTATADLGWRAEILDATAPETARPLLTTGTPPDLPELLLVVTRDSAREPEVAGLLRVRVTFRDRAGALGDTALTFQFVDAGPVLVPVSFEDYVLTLQDLRADDDEAAASSAAGEVAGGGSLIAGPDGEPVAQGLLSTQIIWGTVDFWDTRPRFSSTGSRHQTCVDTDHTCDPATTGCCFSALQLARVTVQVRVQGGDWTDLFQTGLNTYGFYYGITTSMPPYVKDARIVVSFDQAYPGGASDFQLAVAPTIASYVTDKILYIGNMINDEVIPLGRFDVNQAGDTTSLNGDVAATWATMMDADARLAEDGETTQRSGIGGAHFVLADVLEAQVCPKAGPRTQYVPPSEARSFDPARAMGQELQSAAVGCSSWNSWPEFPVYNTNVQDAVNDDRFDSDTGEGVALVEAINELVVLLTWWDPATTTWPTLAATPQYKCIKNSPTAGYCNFKGQWVVTGTDGKSNSNNLSSYLNNAFALWNLIDSSSANTYYCKSDTVDLTVHDLIVALQAWQAGPQNGQNGDADEMSLVNPTGVCTSSAGCSTGEVCAGTGSDQCYSGDPHGSNLRDWIRYLPSWIQSTAVSSIISQECVGIEDNSYPFRGGYHGD